MSGPEGWAVFLKGVSLYYHRRRPVLRGVHMQLRHGEGALIVGRSGVGKTSILRILHREVVPQTGEVWVLARDLRRLRPGQVYRLRRWMGVVFQDFQFLEHRTIAENLALVLEVRGLPAREIRRRVRDALEEVGLQDRERAFPEELSLGELQRAAFARAIVGNPRILLADEPSGNLDPENTRIIAELLQRARRRGSTVLVATHDPLLLECLQDWRIFRLEDGLLTEDAELGHRVPGIPA